MSLRAALSLLAAVCACRVDRCACFPNGSVAFSCGNMMPVHPPYNASTISPPFTVSTSNTTYRPGGVITVTVEGVNSTSEFRGFMLQARSTRQQASMWPVGKFTNIDSALFTALDCNSKKNSTVTQASGSKKNKVQLNWEAPSDTGYGDVYFSASLVQNYTTFWVRLNSSTVRADSGGTSVFSSSSSSALLFISLLSLSADY